MKGWFLNFSAIAILLVTSISARADLKIKTKTTAMGHTTESTVYIKGARERREMSFGGRFDMVTITQCDQKRMVSIMGQNCTSMQMGANGETACPQRPMMPRMGNSGSGESGGRGGMFGGMFGRHQASEEEQQPAQAPRKGGVLTITRTSTDTGERQEMFGYKAKHIKTTMTVESSPDACNQSHAKIETDGWYADVSTAFSCGDEGVRAVSCGYAGGGPPSAPSCQDRIVMKGSAGGIAPAGYPLKQTMTMTSDKGTFTTETEVTELSTVTLDPSLFEAPGECKQVSLPTNLAGAEPSSAPAPAPETTTPAPAPKAEAAPAASPAPAAAPKAAGVVRVGVVKINDATGQGLPTDNLIMDLTNEITTRNMEAVQLQADSPEKDVLSEARAKDCDYVLYTSLKQVADPGSALPVTAVPKGSSLNPANAQAVTDMTLYKVTKPLPEIKDAAIAADAPQLGVNAVMATFTAEAEKIAEQVKEDAHPKAAKSIMRKKSR